MKVYYEKTSNKFKIYTQFFELDTVRSLPTRTFSDKEKAWYAPATKQNCLKILDWPRSCFDVGVYKIVEDVAFSVIKKDPFPKDYEFVSQPLDKQREALDHVYSLEGSGLFMDMGTGKTKTSLDVMYAKYKKGIIDAILVICPCAVLS